METWGGNMGASASFYEYEATKADMASPPMASYSSPIATYSSPRGLSPNAKASVPAPVVLPSIFDQITLWFLGIINRKKLVASCMSAGVSGLVFLAVTTLLSLSLWTPFSSIYAMISLLISPSAWTSSIFISLVVAISFGTLTVHLATPDAPRHYSLLNSNAWISFVAVLMGQMCFVYTSHSMSATLLEGLRSRMTWCSVLMSSFFVIFRLDHRLVFSSHHSKLWMVVSGSFTLTGGSPLMLSVRDVATMYRAFIPLSFVAGVLFDGFYEATMTVISPSVHVAILSTMIAHLTLARIATKIIRQVVMQPVSFPIPPNHLVVSPTPEQTRSLFNVLESSDLTLRLFGLYDLCRIARGGGERRVEMFTLSIPGSHPRNWVAVSSMCLRSIEHIRSKVEQAARDLRGGFLFDDNSEEYKKEMEIKLMPEWRRAMLAKDVRSRFEAKQNAIQQRRREFAFPTLRQRIYRVIESRPNVVERHDALIVELAAESVSSLVCASYEEDRYGVVQRDMAKIIQALLRFITLIDEYYMARGCRATEGVDDEPLVAVGEALSAALHRIKSKFGDSLKVLDMSENELAALNCM